MNLVSFPLTYVIPKLGAFQPSEGSRADQVCTIARGTARQIPRPAGESAGVRDDVVQVGDLGAPAYLRKHRSSHSLD